MGLENSQVIDAIGTEAETGIVVLSIIDGWDWTDEAEHLMALQDKINAYLGFVESGQIGEVYPDAVGHALKIDIISMFPLPDTADSFIEEAAKVSSQLKIDLNQRMAP